MGELLLDDGQIVLLELAGDGPAGVQRVSRGGVMAGAAETLQQALGRVRPALGAVLDDARRLSRPPAEVTVEFGITPSAEGGDSRGPSRASGARTARSRAAAFSSPSERCAHAPTSWRARSAPPTPRRRPRLPGDRRLPAPDPALGPAAGRGHPLASGHVRRWRRHGAADAGGDGGTAVWDHAFRVLGFPRRTDEHGVRADGKRVAVAVEAGVFVWDPGSADFQRRDPGYVARVALYRRAARRPPQRH
ncbi:CU044_2847 family protein [Streptomyces sp. P17]|uniref:CU044_2847 family protein n=1 Tax=Streptomyces sp. P17 TaxID=3074716 RepID=UPI0028F43EE4|nr:CU044_2847 family protein [Streptomyces sp. P17]MDT9696087.1 CU044_2847 family protein [Streptomyces sp. P17]